LKLYQEHLNKFMPETLRTGLQIPSSMQINLKLYQEHLNKIHAGNITDGIANPVQHACCRLSVVGCQLSTDNRQVAGDDGNFDRTSKNNRQLTTDN